MPKLPGSTLRSDLLTGDLYKGGSKFSTSLLSLWGLGWFSTAIPGLFVGPMALFAGSFVS